MKKFYLLSPLFFLTLILMIQPASAQDSTANQKIKSYSEHFVAFSKRYPQEKVYLHFDNTSYYLGESIWFKAYAVSADRNLLSKISKIRPTESQKERLSLTFFLEGGNLIEHIPSKVAFKATTQNGEDAIITGTVFNDKNEKVLELNTDYQGMGLFQFAPDAGKYYARVTANGHDYRFDLPVALSTGYALTVDNSTDQNLEVLIQKNSATKGEPLGLSVSSRGVLYVFKEINTNTEHAIAFNIAKKLLPNGVAQITLYNASGAILGERLAFINHQNQLKISVSQNKQVYQPLEEVNMNFLLTDPQSNPVETTFSLSVRDGSTTSNNPYSNNILTDLLLSSEIKGYIENPGLYFQVNDIPHQRALDLLLLTQGWTRYSWKQMAGITPFEIKQPVEKQQIIDGNVASLVLKRKLKNVDVSMILLTDSASQQGKCKTDSVGNFNFGLMDFQGNAKLILQSKVKDKRKATRIMLNRQFTPDLQPYTVADLNTNQDFKKMKKTFVTSDNDTAYIYSAENQKDLPMSEHEHLLKAVTVKEKLLPAKVSLKYDIAKEMDKMEDTGEWEPTDIYGFLYKTNKYVKAIPQPDGSTKITYKNKPIRFVRDDSYTLVTEAGSNGSGVKVKKNDSPKIISLLIDEIESISIIEDYGTIVTMLHGTVKDPTNVVVALIKYKKNYQPDPNGIRNTTFSGFSYTREFFSPQYNHYRVPNEKDYRRTLYWNPDVKTDKDGRAQVRFYNNSSCKEMNISAETITESGVIGTLNE